MLLRLLPQPAVGQVNPPTILFTLAMPSHPYTSKSLPLPANLLAHKTVCLQEDLDCSNVLLGERSSWIQGIITDVTFSLVDKSVSIELVDGTKTCHAISVECEKMLRQVCREVELSLKPVAPSPPRTRANSAESDVSTHSTSKRSILYSLISPLFPVPQETRPIVRTPPARLHRRQARSILVDTFRRFILPTLKAQLPSAYLPWIANLEISRQLEAFKEISTRVDNILATCQISYSPRVPLKRFRTCAASSTTSSEESDSDLSGCESTPATSVFSEVGNSDRAPHNFASRVPPVDRLPVERQAEYERLLDMIADMAARIQGLKRLNAKFGREEGKRAWLDDLERRRIADRALRRALSDGELTRERCKRDRIVVEPMTKSRLWQSWTAADQARKEREQAIHPAMVDDMPEDVIDSDEESEDDMPITPTQVVFGLRTQHVEFPSASSSPSPSRSSESYQLYEEPIIHSPAPETESTIEPAPWADPSPHLHNKKDNLAPGIPLRSPRRRQPLPNHVLLAA